MKNLSLWIALPLVVLFFSCNAKRDQALNYCNKLANLQSKIVDAQVNLTSILETYDPQLMHDQLAILKSEVLEAKVLADSLSFEKGKRLKNVLLEFLDYAEYSCENELLELITLLEIPSQEYDSEDEAKYMEIVDLYEKRTTRIMNEFITEQKAFAKAHNFHLQLEDGSIF
jgi:hypothetical protein